MRDIKFRWWKYGVMCYHYDGWCEDIELNEALKLSGSYGSDHAIMQFTGLKDKHGNDIFEGDILSGSYGIPGRSILAPVEYQGSGFYAITEGHNPNRCLVDELIDHLGEVEIRGNIYESPELMEVDK